MQEESASPGCEAQEPCFLVLILSFHSINFFTTAHTINSQHPVASTKDFLYDMVWCLGLCAWLVGHFRENLLELEN